MIFDLRLYSIPEHCYDALGLSPEHGPYTCDTNALANLEYLELDGDLYWLMPPSVDTAEDSGDGDTDNFVSQTILDDVVKQTKRLDVILPDSFVNLMGSKKSVDRVPTSDGWRFALGPLMKCPANIDQGAGGYLVKFHENSTEGKWAKWMLYLDLGENKSHCVLSCWCDIDDYTDYLAMDKYYSSGIANGSFTETEVDEAKKDGVAIAFCWNQRTRSRAHWVATISFEDFIAQWYFGILLRSLIKDAKQPASPALKQYVVHTYKASKIS